MRTTSLGLVALLLLAGCSDGGDAAPEADFSGLDLTASQTTGILRGVVVDAAVRPVVDAAVEGRGPEGATASTTTTADGLFGLDGLAPGTWFLTVSKDGYLAAQSSADVLAGVPDPPITKVLLQVDVANLPYVEAYVFDGYLECGVTTPPVGVAVCFAAGDTLNDNTQAHYKLTGNATWAQSEMVWESTQQLGNELALMYSWDGGCGLLCDHEVDGVSPLLLQANQTVMGTIQDNTDELYVRVFNSDLDETDAGLDAVCTPVEDPAFGNIWCLANGWGLTLEQKFAHYTHIFYGYAPPAEWRFTSGEPVPAPPPI